MPYDTLTQRSVDLSLQIEHQFVLHVFLSNQLQNNLRSLDFFAKQVILITHNIIAAEINSKLLNAICYDFLYYTYCRK